MNSHVGVTVAFKAFLMVYLYAAQPQLSPFGEAVAVISLANSEVGHSNILASSAPYEVTQTVHIE